MCSVKSSCTALNRDDVYRDSEEKDVIQKDVIRKIIKSLAWDLVSIVSVSLYHCELKIPSGCQKVPMLSIPFRYTMVSSKLSHCLIRQDALSRHPSCLAAIKPG